MQGRKIDAKLKKRFLEELEKCGGILTVACKRVGISPKSFYRLCTDGYDLYDPEFAKEAELIRDSTAGMYAESGLAFYLKKRNLKAIMFYQASRNNKFTPKLKVEEIISQSTDVSLEAQAGIKAYENAAKQSTRGNNPGEHPGVDQGKKDKKRKGGSD